MNDDSDFEVWCSLAYDAARQIDNGKFVIGHLASKVVTKYKGKRMDEFARRANISRRSAYEYLAVVEFWQSCASAQFLEHRPAITYSHLRLVMRFYEDYYAALLFIEQAAAENWTVDQCLVELIALKTGKPKPPFAIVRGQAVIQRVAGRFITLELADYPEDMLEGYPVDVVIRPAGERKAVSVPASERRLR